MTAATAFNKRAICCEGLAGEQIERSQECSGLRASERLTPRASLRLRDVRASTRTPERQTILERAVPRLEL
jgi:hypothetical protein